MTARSARKSQPHVVPPFSVKGGELMVGGLPLSRLAARVGQTPFYAYDRTKLTERAEALKAELSDHVRLHFAMKANPMPALVCHMAGIVDGCDVASGGELKVALDAGFEPPEISFAGPGKSDSEIHQAVASGILVNVESFREIRILSASSEELGLPARVSVRVNPDFDLKRSGMRMGGGPKQFGIDSERVPEALAMIAEHGLSFEGFQIFAGSQNLSAESLAEAQSKSFELALALSASAPAAVRCLNLGGGFGVPYFPGDGPLNIGAAVDTLNQVAERSAEELGAHVVLELGRFLVSEAGIYVCRVIDKKPSRGHTFLVTDGGLHHHLSASGNFGQVIRRNYPVVLGTRMGDEEARERVSVVGPLCTPLDVLADDVELPQAVPGDLVVVFQSGAYGVSASPSEFLSHPPVVEVLV